MEFLKPKTSCKTSCFFLNNAMFWRFFWKNIDVDVFDNVLQNAKHQADDVNRPPPTAHCSTYSSGLEVQVLALFFLRVFANVNFIPLARWQWDNGIRVCYCSIHWCLLYCSSKFQPHTEAGPPDQLFKARKPQPRMIRMRKQYFLNCENHVYSVRTV